MDAWEIALNKINEQVQGKKLRKSVPSKDGMSFFECNQGQFALEVPRRTRGVKGAKFWFSFPPNVPHDIKVEAKAAGVGRNNKLNTTPGSRMGESQACWSILVDNSRGEPDETIEAIVSGLCGAAAHLSKTESVAGISIANESDEKSETPLPANHTAVPEGDQTILESDTVSLTTSEREAVVKVRFGQGGFRALLLEVAGDVCWMSGIEGKELLIASHIQPWAHCEKNPDARGCSDNGLLLSSLWDAAFDAGLLTFDVDWRVVTSSSLSDSAKKHLGLEEERFLPEAFRNLRRAHYLAYHREKVFKQ